MIECMASMTSGGMSAKELMSDESLRLRACE